MHYKIDLTPQLVKWAIIPTLYFILYDINFLGFAYIRQWRYVVVSTGEVKN